MEKIIEKLQKETLTRVRKYYSFDKNEIEIGVECLPVDINCITEIIEGGQNTVKFNIEINNAKYVWNGNFCFINEKGERNVCLWYGVVSTKNKLLGKYSIGDEIEDFTYFPLNGQASDENSEVINNYDPNKFYATLVPRKTCIMLSDDGIPYIIENKYTIPELEEIKPEDLMFVYAYTKKKEE